MKSIISPIVAVVFALTSVPTYAATPQTAMSKLSATDIAVMFAMSLRRTENYLMLIERVGHDKVSADHIRAFLEKMDVNVHDKVVMPTYENDMLVYKIDKKTFKMNLKNLTVTDGNRVWHGKKGASAEQMFVSLMHTFGDKPKAASLGFGIEHAAYADETYDGLLAGESAANSHFTKTMASFWTILGGIGAAVTGIGVALAATTAVVTGGGLVVAGVGALAFVIGLIALTYYGSTDDGSKKAVDKANFIQCNKDHQLVVNFSGKQYLLSNFASVTGKLPQEMQDHVRNVVLGANTHFCPSDGEPSPNDNLLQLNIDVLKVFNGDKAAVEKAAAPADAK